MRRLFPIILWLCGCLLAALLLVKTPLNNDLTFFLPKKNTLVDQILLQQMREGPVSRMIMIGISGGSPEERAYASRSLVKALQKIEQFRRVTNGDDPLLLQRLEDRLLPYRFHLMTPEGLDPYSSSTLHTTLTRRLDDLYSPMAPVMQRWLERDPLGLWHGLILRLLGTHGPLREGGLWISEDHQRSLVLAETTASGFDLEGQREAQNLILEQFKGLQLPPTLGLTLGGPGAMSVSTHDLITREATRLSFINSFLVMVFLLLIYRSWRFLGLGLLPLLTGVLAGGLTTLIVFGELHGITLGFGSTLLGVAADYPNHLFTHLERHESPEHTMKRLWPTLGLGVLTNVAGFGAMLFSGFSGLSQLAVFAGSGLLAAALTTRFILPPWIKEPPSGPLLVHKNVRLTPSEQLKWRWSPALPLVIMSSLLAYFWMTHGTLFNDDIAALNPVPKETLRVDAMLQHDFNSPELGKMLLLKGPDAELLLQDAEAIEPMLVALQKAGTLSHFDLLTHYLPSLQRQRDRLAQLPPHAELLAHLKKAQEGLPFRSGLFEPFLNEVDQARTIEFLSPTTLKDLPMASLVDSSLIHLQEEWALLIPLYGVRDDLALQQAVDSQHLDHLQYLDLKIRTSNWMTQYRQEALSLLGVGLMAITGILWIGLRSLIAVFKVLAPMLAAGISTAILMAIVDHGLNIYHLVSLLLIMGLSLDQALFFHRPSRDLAEYKKTRLSLLVCSLSSILVFGTLAFAHVAILDTMGMTVSIGAFLAITFAALLANTPPSSA